MRLGEISIVTGGLLSLAVSIGHASFHRLFGWGEDLGRLTPANRTVLYTIHVALYLLFLPFALVSLRYPEELARPGGVGGTLALSYAAFWAWRLAWQGVYFRQLTRVSRGWRRFHPVLIALLVIIVAAYGGPVTAAWLSAR